MNPPRTEEFQMRPPPKSNMAGPDMETLYFAKVLDEYTDSVGEGFVLELIKGRFSKAAGPVFKIGDKLCCQIRPSAPGDICAYFESAYVPDGTLCKIAPYDTGLARRYVPLPILQTV